MNNLFKGVKSTISAAAAYTVSSELTGNSYTSFQGHIYIIQSEGTEDLTSHRLISGFSTAHQSVKIHIHVNACIL